MSRRKIVRKIVRSIPLSGSYIKRNEQLQKELRSTIKRLEERNEEWAKEVRELRGDGKKFNILWPASEEDILSSGDLKKQIDNSPKKHSPPYVLNWVIPPVGPVSGGHAVIIYLIRYLESKGFVNRIYIYDPLKESNLETIQNNLKNHVEIKSELFYNSKTMAPCDALFATSWPTAYPVYNYKASAKKFYLLQDYEPMFSPSGTYSALAENTYKMGLHGVSTTPFTSVEAKKHGMEVDQIELGINEDEYYLTNRNSRKKIAFYARPVSPRRGFELGSLALEIFHKKWPEYEINCYGWDLDRFELPFPSKNLGILSTSDINALYNQSAAGLALSFTSMSLTAVEMMAAGCVPVTNNGPDSGLVSYSKNLVIGDANPTSLAEALERAVKSQKDKSKAGELASYAKNFGWDKYNSALEDILLRELA